MHQVLVQVHSTFTSLQQQPFQIRKKSKLTAMQQPENLKMCKVKHQDHQAQDHQQCSTTNHAGYNSQFDSSSAETWHRSEVAEVQQRVFGAPECPTEEVEKTLT